MKRLLFMMIAAFVGVGLAPARDVSALEAPAAEYRALREQPGHFSGGAWNDDVDRFGGRKHRVMAKLGELLGDSTYTRVEVVRLMGAPDEVLRAGDMMFRQSYDGGDRRVRELLVYHWRGRHDFLFFTSDGRRVLASGWWAALE